MVCIHRRHHTYTVAIVGVRDGAQTGNDPSPRRSPYTGTRCPYTVLHCFTIGYATLRTAQNVMDQSIFHSSLLTFPKFICSVALLLLHHCRRRIWVVLYRLLLQHGCGTITRTSNAVEGLAAAAGRALTNYYCETWSHGKKEGKAKKKKPQSSRYKKEIPDFLFAKGLEKRRKSKKKKPQRSKYKDEISEFLFAEGLEKKKKNKKRSRKEVDIKTKFPISYFEHACPK